MEKKNKINNIWLSKKIYKNIEIAKTQNPKFSCNRKKKSKFLKK